MYLGTKLWKTLVVFILVFVMSFSPTVYATTSSIQDAEDKKDELETKKQELEDAIDSLEAEKDDIVAYIEKLDTQLTDLNEQVAELKDKIETANANLEQIKADLEEAQESEENQYDTMKKRIKYMYENGNQGYLDVILSADSFSDLLNRVDYVAKIRKYDDNLLEQYQETKQLIEDKKQEQEDTIQSLKDMKEELTVEQDAVEQLVAKKTEQLNKKNSKISSSKNQVSEYESAISEQEELLEELLEEERKKAEEEAAAKKKAEEEAAAAKENSSSSSSSSSGSSSSGSSSSGSTSVSSSGYAWPLGVSGTITSTFGYRDQPTAGASTYHKGIDIAVASGTAVKASASGTITTASYQSAAGNYIQIYHGGSTYTVYMHLSRISVSAGQTVSQGDIIGYSGSTGVSTGPHLHFGVSVNGSYVNPLNYVSQP